MKTKPKLSSDSSTALNKNWQIIWKKVVVSKNVDDFMFGSEIQSHMKKLKATHFYYPDNYCILSVYILKQRNEWNQNQSTNHSEWTLF